MHLPAMITDLAVMLLTAGVITIIFKKIKQSLVIGLLADLTCVIISILIVKIV